LDGVEEILTALPSMYSMSSRLPDHPWLRAPRLYVTPHLGGTLRESILRIGQIGIENVFRWARGEPLRDIINGVQPAQSSPEKG
jgi:phosphoglycerate dehydrogenase-like enzyme